MPRFLHNISSHVDCRVTFTFWRRVAAADVRHMREPREQTVTRVRRRDIRTPKCFGRVLATVRCSVSGQWGKEIADLVNPSEHLVRREPEQGRVLLLGAPTHLVESNRCRDEWFRHRPNRIDADGRLGNVVLAPVDQDAVLAGASVACSRRRDHGAPPRVCVRSRVPVHVASPMSSSAALRCRAEDPWSHWSLRTTPHRHRPALRRTYSRDRAALDDGGARSRGRGRRPSSRDWPAPCAARPACHKGTCSSMVPRLAAQARVGEVVDDHVGDVFVAVGRGHDDGLHPIWRMRRDVLLEEGLSRQRRRETSSSSEGGPGGAAA